MAGLAEMPVLCRRPLCARGGAMKEHDLKCWPPFWEDVDSGRKTFELRKDDRAYEVGDVIVLREWHPGVKLYTGRVCRRTVSYKLGGGSWGLADGYCIPGLEAP